MAERNLLFKFLKFYDKKYFVPKHWEAILAQNLILKICFIITCFNQTLPCHKFFFMKDQKLMRKDMKESWNSVLDFAGILKMSN